MANRSIILTAEFDAAVTHYQRTRGLPSWTAALLELATQGYEAATGQPAPAARNPHGGWRGSENSLNALAERRSEDDGDE